MIKALLGVALAIALTSAGAYAAFSHPGGSEPALVPSVKVAPLQAGQGSQAKLAPVDPTVSDGFTASNKPAALDSKAAYSGPQFDSNSQASTSNSPSTTTPTAIVPNAVLAPMALGFDGSSNISVVTNPNPITDPTALALNAYNQALLSITALNISPDIKAQILQLMQSMRTQILATSMSAQPAATSTTALVGAVNAFLTQVNNLNMIAGDRANAYSALFSSLGTLPGVNTSFATLAPAPTTQFPTASNPIAMAAQIQAQSQSTYAQVQANLDAERRQFAARQNEITASTTGQLNGMSATDFANAVLNSIYAQAGVNLSH